LSDDHQNYLSEEYFPLVGAIQRHPRYVNKRIMDPQLRCYLDEKKIQLPEEWGLPTPNPQAAYKSLAKYAKPLLPMSDEMVSDMNLAWEWTTRHFGLYMSGARVLSYEEAKQKMDMSTSCGAPFNQLYKTKRELFESDPTIDEWLQEDWDRLANDPLWTTIFTNSLKEEIRPTEKIIENSIRTFTAGGCDATVHGTRLFVDMNERMYASHLKTSSAVGMSPYYGNWNKLYIKLKTFKKGYALDESAYDSSLRAYMMWGCALLRWKMLRSEDQTDDNLRRLKNYYRNLVHSVIVTQEGVLVMKKTGNPSGSVNTITDNTLILYTLLAYAWIRNSPSEERTFESFELNTAKALVGDDNTWSVSDLAHPFYNARSVIQTWNTLGVTTTTDSLEHRKPEDLDFLSAHTVFLDGVAVPVYSRAKLMSSLLYAPKLDITPCTTLERTAAMLSVGWTDISFRRFCRSVISWLLDKYDDVLFEDGRWISAKTQIKDDSQYYRLFTGQRPIFLRPQSVLGASVKWSPPNKNLMNASKVNSKRGKPQTRKRNATNKRRRAQKPPPQAGKQMVVARKRRNRPAPSNSTKTGMRSKKSCTVVEDEFIGAVNGSVAFAVTQYPINPGQATTFPWLSQQAIQWEKYRFNYLEFYYKREVSEFATNGTTGKVIMSVDFDASDPAPTSKQQMEDSDPRVDGMPCENLRMHLLAKQLHPLNPVLYVRRGGVPGSADIKTYDAGNFNIATQGLQNTSEIGELRVRYSVTFSVPVLDAVSVAPRNNSVTLLGDASRALTSSVPLTLLWSTVLASGISYTNLVGAITLPAGNYLIDITCEMTYTGNSTQSQLSLVRDGVTTLEIATADAVLAAGRVPMSLTYFVSATSTSFYEVRATGVFSSGTAATQTPILRIVAI